MVGTREGSGVGIGVGRADSVGCGGVDGRGVGEKHGSPICVPSVRMAIDESSEGMGPQSSELWASSIIDVNDVIAPNSVGNVDESELKSNHSPCSSFLSCPTYVHHDWTDVISQTHEELAIVSMR